MNAKGRNQAYSRFKSTLQRSLGWMASNQLTTYLGQLLHLYSPWWSSLAIINTIFSYLSKIWLGASFVRHLLYFYCLRFHLKTFLTKSICAKEIQSIEWRRVQFFASTTRNRHADQKWSIVVEKVWNCTTFRPIMDSSLAEVDEGWYRPKSKKILS